MNRSNVAKIIPVVVPAAAALAVPVNHAEAARVLAKQTGDRDQKAWADTQRNINAIRGAVSTSPEPTASVGRAPRTLANFDWN